MEALEGAFNNKKAQIGAFSIIVKLQTLWIFVSSSSIGSDVPGANVWNAVRLKEAAGHRSERVLTQVAAN